MWAARQNHRLHDAKHNPQPMPSIRKRVPGGSQVLADALVMMTTASSDTTIHPAFTSRTSQALLFEAAFRHSLYVLRKRRKGGVKTLGRFGETPDGAESKRVRCSKRGPGRQAVIARTEVRLELSLRRIQEIVQPHRRPHAWHGEAAQERPVRR